MKKVFVFLLLFLVVYAVNARPPTAREVSTNSKNNSFSTVTEKSAISLEAPETNKRDMLIPIKESGYLVKQKPVILNVVKIATQKDLNNKKKSEYFDNAQKYKIVKNLIKTG